MCYALGADHRRDASMRRWKTNSGAERFANTARGAGRRNNARLEFITIRKMKHARDQSMKMKMKYAFRVSLRSFS